MARKIILLSDGTGNSAAKVWRTNVWRTFEALDLSGNDQVALYDDGVGTSSFKPMAILGGAFGFGLRRNVIALYKFACRNYRHKDDELFGFGFSRGAFTIRIVMGMIDSQGLVKADSEAELDSLASAAYRAYRRHRYHHLKLEAPYQWIRNKFGPVYPPKDPQKVRKNIKVRFIGVWDTVAAYGMPVDEMTRGIHDYLWPIELPNKRLADSVARACQALALDEERTTFHPQLWDEPAPPLPDVPGGEGKVTPAATAGPRYIKNERLSQVWFAGVHTNVGGGYPDDALAYIPFVWMITEAKRCGLKFKSDYANDPINPDVMRADPDTFKNAISKRDKDGRLYDPRKGLGGYYRYGPRKLVPTFYPEVRKLEDDEVEVGRAKIHESVFKRIENHAQAYAPIGLPPFYDVVKDDGEIVSPDKFSIAPATKPFETSAEAAQRALAQEHVWNEVWKRRITYFATVGATFWLLIFPLASSAQRADEYYSRLRWVSDLVRIVGGFLPKFASTWIDGYARAPFWFVVIAVLLACLLGWSSRIASRTSSLMGAIWRQTRVAPSGLPHNFIYKLRSNKLYIGFHEGLKRNIAPGLFAIVFVYFGLSIASHALFNILDVWGQTCLDHAADPTIPPATKMKVDEERVIPFDISRLCNATGVDLDSDGARYYIKIDASGVWTNGAFPIPVGGYAVKSDEFAVNPNKTATWGQRFYLTLFLPLRRELSDDWFRFVLRYGRTGGEEHILEPDPTDPLIEDVLRPKRRGHLFIFINDAVIGLPFLYGAIYKNNTGTGQLTVRRTK
jgi:uncharacterized protein (DUF2235 family)